MIRSPCGIIRIRKKYAENVRICNLSYAQTDWYIYQQQCPLYDAPGLPISWDQNQYQEGKNEYVAVRPELKKQIEELYQKHPEEARDSFGDDPYEIKKYPEILGVRGETGISCRYLPIQ